MSAGLDARIVLDLIREADLGILAAFNAQARVSPVFDMCLAMAAQNQLVKSVFLVGILWFFWFSPKHRVDHRMLVVRIVLGAGAAITVGRAGQIFLPERLRPVHDPTLDFVVPRGIDTHGLIESSSFPSDHAILYFAIATGVWAISRRFGVLAFLWAIVVTFVARVYAGLHYPSDIVIGAVLGVGIMSFTLREKTIMPRIVDLILTLESRWAGFFYVAAFIVNWQIAELFGGVRHVTTVCWRIARFLMLRIAP
jgi:undecaprenyl-diphosphatase